MIVTRGSASTAAARLEADLGAGNLLILEAPEQEFAGIEPATNAPERNVSNENGVTGTTSDLQEFVAFEFAGISEVEYVFTAFRENQIFYVWIVTNDFEAAVRERIYVRQQAIIDEFKEFEFDFYIIARVGRNLEDLISDDSMHLTYAKPR